MRGPTRQQTRGTATPPGARPGLPLHPPWKGSNPIPTALKTRAAAIAAAVAIAVGGALITATPASAVGSSSCNWTWAYAQDMKTNTAVNLRNGPSTSYYSKGILSKGTRFKEYCNKDFNWSYGKVLTGANAGKWGWVYSSYLDFYIA